MTDKEQIIVDGVNIIDCNDYYVEQETDQVKCDLSGEYCRENKNCFYKQLARKEQECEELKKELNGSEKWRIKAESLNEKLELNNGRYRKALEEIENFMNYEFSGQNEWVKTNILNIISREKGER